MTRRFPTLLALLALAFAATASAEPAPVSPMTVVVLYFDNNTSDASYDVLQKGLADMMVTDLTSVGNVQVVEREKLQKLIDELKLQRSRYFDPATAQRIGRGIGATHAVTGSIAAVDPQVRIDVRLVDVSTARVVMADKVVGTRDRFFDLEADLAARFAKALQPDAKTPATAPARNGQADIETVLAYSKGLDAADRGDYEGASKTLATVVTRAPKFRLAQERYAALLKKLYEARARREQVLESGEDLLRRAVRENLAKTDALSGDEKTGLAFLGYRTLACQLALVDLGRAIGLAANAMDGSTVVPLAANVRGKALPLMRAYFEEVARLSAELATFEAAHPKRMPGSGDFRIANEDTERARALGIRDPGRWSFAASWRIARAAAHFAFLGKPDFWSTVRFGTNPSLVELDAAFIEHGLAQLDRALDIVGKARFPNESLRQRDEIDILDLYGQSLMRIGRRPEAVARWQAILDKYPTCEKYAQYERNIQDALGVATTDPALTAALDRCDPLSLAGPWSTVAIPRFQSVGPSAFDELAEEVDAKCGKDPRFVPMGEVFWFSAGMVGLAAGPACDFGRRMLQRVGSTDTGKAMRPQLEKTLAEKCP